MTYTSTLRPDDDQPRRRLAATTRRPEPIPARPRFNGIVTALYIDDAMTTQQLAEATWIPLDVTRIRLKRLQGREIVSCVDIGGRQVWELTPKGREESGLAGEKAEPSEPVPPTPKAKDAACEGRRPVSWVERRLWGMK